MAATFIGLALALPLASCARRPPEPSIRVEGAWARAVPALAGGVGEEMGSHGMASPGMGGMGMESPVAGGSAGAAYLTIVNAGGAPDALVSARSDVCERVEIHTASMEGGVMRMSPLPRLEIPAGGRVELRPGGLHLMLMGLKQDLRPGERFSLTLVFQRSGAVQVEVEVREG